MEVMYLGSVKDVYNHGIETVSAALASALAQIAPINPYRVRVFYVSTPFFLFEAMNEVSSPLATSSSLQKPTRILLQLQDTGADKSLRVFFSVDEKTDVKPSIVPKYNYTVSFALVLLVNS